MNFKELFKVRPAGLEKEGYMITLGNHLATEELFDTVKKAERRINMTDWNLVSAVVCAVMEAIEHEKSIKEEKEVQNG